MLDLFAGRDATVLPGITDYSWLQIYSETGTDLERWPSEKHFTSWLGLSPGQNDSGNSKKRAKKKDRPNAGQIFRLLAQTLLQSKKISFGAFRRRLRGAQRTNDCPQGLGTKDRCTILEIDGERAGIC
ncbi:Transposase IS116/IS110/IS902 family protein [compost metagenome]